MYNQLLLSLVISAVPILAFIFVGALLLQKLYVKIRSNFNASVNCWFCNRNTRVPYLNSNCWTCPHCDQYNGFTKDGDYNREMFQQFDCTGSSKNSTSYSEHNISSSLVGAQRNGFCHDCNEAQRLKVEKLAQFEPKNESRFDDELKAYKEHLEEQYRLCTTCEHHLHKVLREKKKMVLGSKFLEFILKGAENFRKPYFDNLYLMQRQNWKQRLTVLITLLTVMNVICLFSTFPAITRERLTQLFGQSIGEQVFILLSHAIALGRVVRTYFERIGAHPNIAKANLFVRTICMMLLYSLGLKMPQITHFNIFSLYILFYPFALLALTFIYNIVDRFKLTRFTFLLALWSTFAAGLIEEQLYFTPDVLMLMSSLLTFALSLTNKIKASPKLHDKSSNSFHKIYSEDYLSDEDTISLLSQQLNVSTASTTHSTSIRSPMTPMSVGGDSAETKRYTKSPFTSSMHSFNNLQNANSSTNSKYNYNPCYSQYAPSLSEFNTATSTTTLPANSPIFRNNSRLVNGHGYDGTQTSVYGSRFNEDMDTLPLIMPTNNPFNNLHPSSTTNLRGFSTNTSSLHSPFSLSKGVQNKLRRMEYGRNLLTPSRLNATRLTYNASATTWLTADDCFSQRTTVAEARVANPATNGNLSRGSSQSSGFESQNDRVNASRENSYGTENQDLLQRTKPLDTTRAFQPIDAHGREHSFSVETADLRQHTKPLDTHRAFQPIDANVRPVFSSRSSVLSDAQLLEPNTLDWLRTSDLSAPLRRERDSFNLRKINAELPTIKPGDLLRKWKESQMVS